MVLASGLMMLASGAMRGGGVALASRCDVFSCADFQEILVDPRAAVLL